MVDIGGCRPVRLKADGTTAVAGLLAVGGLSSFAWGSMVRVGMLDFRVE
jgi:hypothetical protein